MVPLFFSTLSPTETVASTITLPLGNFQTPILSVLYIGCPLLAPTNDDQFPAAIGSPPLAQRADSFEGSIF